MKRISRKIPLVLLLSVLGFYFLFLIYSTYWYDSFFRVLDSREIHSCRMVQVWVSPGSTSSIPLPIGGNEQKFRRWVQSVDALCTRAQHYQQSTKFRLDLIVDQNVYDAHYGLREYWSEKYPGMIQWSLWTDHDFQSDERWLPAVEHCQSGCASLCSDFLRGRLLFSDESELNIYMDIDTFSECYANRIFLKSDRVLGAHTPLHSLVNTFFVSPRFVSWNGDFLATLSPSPVLKKLIDVRSAQILQNESHLYHHIAQRFNRSRLSFDEYCAEIDRMVDWAQKNPESELNEYGLILGGIGPGLWLEMMQKGISEPYTWSHVEGMNNYFSWREAARMPSNSQTYSVLSQLYGDSTAQELIRLNFYLYDYLTYQKRMTPTWLKELYEEMQMCWEKIQQTDQSPLMYQEQLLFFSFEELRAS